MVKKIRAMNLIVAFFAFVSCENRKGSVEKDLKTDTNNVGIINKQVIDTTGVNIVEITADSLPKNLAKNGWDIIAAFKWPHKDSTFYVILQEFRSGNIEEEGSEWQQKIILKYASVDNASNHINVIWMQRDSTRNSFDFIDVAKSQLKIQQIEYGEIIISLNYVIVATQGEDPDIFKYFQHSASRTISFIRNISQVDYVSSIDTVNYIKDSEQLPESQRKYFRNEVRMFLHDWKRKMQKAEKAK